MDDPVMQCEHFTSCDVLTPVLANLVAAIVV
jgi:hypothetical protein